MEKNKKDICYRIGLDIGVASVGWSVLQNDPVTEEPIKILKLGVRTFNSNEVQKTGESTAKARREKRGLHRRTRRKAFRLERLKKLLISTFCIDLDKELLVLQNKDVYELRASALDRLLSYGELSKVLLSIAKRRGFRSNRKNIKSGDDGLLLSSIEKNNKLIEEHGYRTIGEALYKDKEFRLNVNGVQIYNIRNHAGDYRNCFDRDGLVKEIRLILESQRKLGNSKIDDSFVDRFIEIFERQRNFDEGPGEPSPYSATFEIGNCTFVKGEKRAPKASFTFEYFNALSKINSLKVNDRVLTLEEKQKLYNHILSKKELKFEQVRSLLNLKDDLSQQFNLCRYVIKKKKDSEDRTAEEIIKECEKSLLVSMKQSYDIKSALGVESSLENKDIINEVAHLLTTCKSDARIDEYIKNSDTLSKLTNEQVENIKSLNFDKVGSLSIVAMERVIPYLEQGHRYDEACKLAGFSHSSFEHEKSLYLKGEKIEERLLDVTSNVVKRAVNQSLRIMNEIIAEYGSPQFVTIELARDIAKDSSERRKIEDAQKLNFSQNEDAKSRLKEEFKLEKATHFDLIKRRLYDEQNGKCMYSGRSIDINQLFEPNFVQVDHIIPYSRCFNDSYNNKVLVLTSENQNKGNRTPYEFFGDDEKKWNEFVARVNCLRNSEKKRLLLKENFGEEQSQEFKERNLNDTRYMARFMLNLISDFLKMRPSNKYKKVVRSVNGSITSYLRKSWGINKIREDGDIHHAIDATIIATTTGGQIQKITTYNKLRERFVKNNDGKYVSRLTGEVMTKEEKDEYIQSGIDIDLLSKWLPVPYERFIDELALRTRIKYDGLDYDTKEKVQLSELGYTDEEVESLKPVFVSRMKNVKSTGAIHEETIMSTREYEKTSRLIKSTGISSLRLSKTTPEEKSLKGDKYPEYSIPDYYRPEDDRLLYLKIKNTLVEQGKIPEKEPFYKPKKDGTDGPLVRSVKVYVNKSNCVLTPNGGAANDRMHRVDVFRGKEDGKFYLCPVYMADVYAKRLPNKVIAIGKEWIDIDDSFEFLFSLYQNDLIKVTSKRDIVLSKNIKNDKSNKPNEIKNQEFLLYYQGTGIATASIAAVCHDRCYSISNLGVKTLLNIEKYHVDIMGKIYKAPKEERKGF